tara:strand:+ start:28 stop:477 length:450 start_codon:yes stop_codon:yes gene_type:complete
MAKKKLSKGFDDLFSQNETELTFLDAYGKSDSEIIEGLPESSNDIQNSEELFEVIIRLLNSEEVIFELTKKKISIGDFLIITNHKNKIKVKINSKKQCLPIVPSDLKAPGFVESKLSKNMLSCTVVISSWGINSKRFISRMVEFYNLNC